MTWYNDNGDDMRNIGVICCVTLWGTLRITVGGFLSSNDQILDSDCTAVLHLSEKSVCFLRFVFHVKKKVRFGRNKKKMLETEWGKRISFLLVGFIFHISVFADRLAVSS